MPYLLPARFCLLLLLGLVIGNVRVYQTVFAPPVLKVSVLDVGKKGGATLIRSPGGATLLVDTGPDASILRALGKELPPWQRSIGAVLLTGTKASLIGGLPEVKSRYRVSAFMHFGGPIAPYGTALVLDNARVEIISPGTLYISYGATSLLISSTTPKGDYVSDEKTITKIPTK